MVVKHDSDPRMARHAVESQGNHMSQYRPIDGRTMRRAIERRRRIKAKQLQDPANKTTVKNPQGFAK